MSYIYYNIPYKYNKFDIMQLNQNNNKKDETKFVFRLTPMVIWPLQSEKV